MTDALVCFECGSRDGAWSATSGVEARLRLQADGAWQTLERDPFYELRCSHCHALAPAAADIVRALSEAVADEDAGGVRLVAETQSDQE